MIISKERGSNYNKWLLVSFMWKQNCSTRGYKRPLHRGREGPQIWQTRNMVRNMAYNVVENMAKNMVTHMAKNQFGLLLFSWLCSYSLETTKVAHDNLIPYIFH